MKNHTKDLKRLLEKSEYISNKLRDLVKRTPSTESLLCPATQEEVDKHKIKINAERSNSALVWLTAMFHFFKITGYSSEKLLPLKELLKEIAAKKKKVVFTEHDKGIKILQIVKNEIVSEEKKELLNLIANVKDLPENLKGQITTNTEIMDLFLANSKNVNTKYIVAMAYMLGRCNERIFTKCHEKRTVKGLKDKYIFPEEQKNNKVAKTDSINTSIDTFFKQIYPDKKKWIINILSNSYPSDDKRKIINLKSRYKGIGNKTNKITIADRKRYIAAHIYKDQKIKQHEITLNNFLKDRPYRPLIDKYLKRLKKL